MHLPDERAIRILGRPVAGIPRLGMQLVSAPNAWLPERPEPTLPLVGEPPVYSRFASQESQPSTAVLIV